jgi:hypothetical protein
MDSWGEDYVALACANKFRQVLDSFFGVDRWRLGIPDCLVDEQDEENCVDAFVTSVHGSCGIVLGFVKITNDFVVKKSKNHGRYIECVPFKIELITKRAYDEGVMKQDRAVFFTEQILGQEQEQELEAQHVTGSDAYVDVDVDVNEVTY